MKALFAIAVLVLAYSSSQAQYDHVRDYQKTNLIGSLNPGAMKRKFIIDEDSSLRAPVFPKTIGVKGQKSQAVAYYPLSAPSIEQATRFHRKKGKGKIDLSFLVPIAYSLFCGPDYTSRYISHP